MSTRRKYLPGEKDLLQTLKWENKALKREITSLRKQIARLGIDRFKNFKDSLDRIDNIEREQAAKKKDRESTKNRWKCWECSEGTLKISIFERKDGVFYMRKCNCCSHRTKLKKYTPEVEQS